MILSCGGSPIRSLSMPVVVRWAHGGAVATTVRRTVSGASRGRLGDRDDARRPGDAKTPRRLEAARDVLVMLAEAVALARSGRAAQPGSVRRWRSCDGAASESV